MKSRKLIGIDPGKTGAMCVRESDGSLYFYDCPLTASKELDYHAMAKLVQPHPNTMVILEDVAAFKMGVTSAFNFGQNISAWRMACAAFGLPVVLVRPAVWTKALGKPGGKENKYASIEMAKALYPESAPYLKRKKDHDRADALLLIHWFENYGISRN
jgi:hypothetical protein